MKTLETQGGHIAVCLVLLVLGFGGELAKLPKSEDLIVFAMGVLARSMMLRRDP